MELTEFKPFNVVEALDPNKQIFFAKDLLDERLASNFIINATNIIDAYLPQAAGSLLGNRFNILSSLQVYCIIHHDCAIDLAKSPIYLQWENKKLLFYFEELHFTFAIQDRFEWREGVYRQLIKETLLPIYQHIHHETKCPVSTIWSNLSHSLQNRHKNWMLEIKDENRRKQGEEDLQHLIKTADPQWFETSKNPLDKEFDAIKHASEEGQSILQRQNCCLAYCLNSKSGMEKVDKYCYTCPNLNEAERVERRLKIKES